MAKIKPFKGVRPPRELVAEVASRPYDVLSSAEAKKEAEGNEKSLYHIIKPEIDFEEGADEHDVRVYDKAVSNFHKFQKNGWLVQDKCGWYPADGRACRGSGWGRGRASSFPSGRTVPHRVAARR